MTPIIAFGQAELTLWPLMLWLFTATMGLIIGSYLNVVIYRLPRMLEIAPLPTNNTTKSFNLWWPRSHCPHCNATLGVRDLIPLVSYLSLGGKCRYCHQPISWSYPIIETVTAATFLCIVATFGLSWLAVASGVLTCSLIVLAVLDYKYHVLPDNVTLPILWLGLLLNINGLFVPVEDAIIGAAVGYLSLWSVFWIHKLITGKAGLGYGDFKFLALLGAWLGWASLPFIVVLASICGLVYAAVQYGRGRLTRTTPLPLGTFLALGGWWALLQGWW